MQPKGVLVAALAGAALMMLAPSALAFDSDLLGPGETWSHTFTAENPDGHTYHCHPHPWMWGMVHVNADTDGATTSHQVSIVEGPASTDWGYEPQHLEIEVGDTVVWTNMGAVQHTVTENEGTGDHDHDHDHMEGHDHDSPGAGAVAVLAAFAVAFLARRR